jgi:hypothetical protein
VIAWELDLMTGRGDVRVRPPDQVARTACCGWSVCSAMSSTIEGDARIAEPRQLLAATGSGCRDRRDAGARRLIMIFNLGATAGARA